MARSLPTWTHVAIWYPSSAASPHQWDACSVPISAARSIYRQLLGLLDGNCSLPVNIYFYNRDPSLSDAFAGPSFSCSRLL